MHVPSRARRDLVTPSQPPSDLLEHLWPPLSQLPEHFLPGINAINKTTLAPLVSENNISRINANR